MRFLTPAFTILALVTGSIAMVPPAAAHECDPITYVCVGPSNSSSCAGFYAGIHDADERMWWAGVDDCDAPDQGCDLHILFIWVEACEPNMHCQDPTYVPVPYCSP